MKDHDPWHMRNNQDEPYDCPSLVHWESLKATKEGWGTHAELSGLPELKCITEYRELKIARMFMTIREARALQEENSEGLLRITWAYLAEICFSKKCMQDTYPRLEKELPPARIKGSNANYSHWTKITAYFC